MTVGIVASAHVVPAGGGGFDPTDLTGLVGWWRSDGAGNSVSQWNDESGGGHHFTQATAGDRPTRTKTLNALTVYTFNGANQAMTGTSTTNYITGSTLTIATVARYFGDPSSDNRLFSSRVSGGTDYGAVTSFYTGCPERWPGSRRNFSMWVGHGAWDAAYVGAWKVAVTVFNGSTASMWIDGAPASTTAQTSTGNFDIDEVYLSQEAGGSTGMNGWDGDVAEIILCNTALSTGDRTAIEGYLDTKWGL